MDGDNAQAARARVHAPDLNVNFRVITLSSTLSRMVTGVACGTLHRKQRKLARSEPQRRNANPLGACPLPMLASKRRFFFATVSHPVLIVLNSALSALLERGVVNGVVAYICESREDGLARLLRQHCDEVITTTLIQGELVSWSVGLAVRLDQ